MTLPCPVSVVLQAVSSLITPQFPVPQHAVETFPSERALKKETTSFSLLRAPPNPEDSSLVGPSQQAPFLLVPKGA